MTYPGFAGAPADPSIACFEDLVSAVVSRIDCPTALIAQSMGGVLAIEAAFRKPSLVTHLVLAATSGGLNTARLGAIDSRLAFMHVQPNPPDWFACYHSDLTNKLGGIDVPVLLIWATRIPLAPLPSGRSSSICFPGPNFTSFREESTTLLIRMPQPIVSLVEEHFRSEFTGSSNRDEEM